MKSNILLFSTRDIGIENTIFEQVVSTQIAESMCKYFFKTNEKELTIEKKKHISPTDDTKLPEKGVIENIIRKGNSGKFPAKVTNILETTSVKELIDKAVKELKKAQKTNHKEDREKAITTLESYLNNEVQFEENDFKNPDVWKWKAINIEKKNRTLKDRISIYKTAEEIFKRREGKKEVEELIQVFAVWSLGTPDLDTNSKTKEDNTVSWVEALVQSIKAVIESANNTGPKDSIIDEIELYMLLHDKDLESTCNVPFKTILQDSKEGINYTLICFTHADQEYDRLRSSKSLSELLNDVIRYSVKSDVFQKLSELSDILAKWTGNFNSDFVSKKNELKQVIGDEWNSKNWSGIRWSFKLLENWNDKTKRKGERLLFVNTQINNKIKEYI